MEDVMMRRRDATDADLARGLAPATFVHTLFKTGTPKTA